MASTIHDVARRAGVSISTVSRVLNKTTRVSEKKRQRVEAAAAALGYTPNPAARSLLNQKTGGLGVLLPFVTGEFFSEFLTAIDQVTQENGHFLLISSSHRSPEEFMAVLPSLDKRVDGLVLMATGGETRNMQAVLPDIPVVFVNSKIEDDTYELINFDNFDGLYQVTTHLIELGHQRLVMLKGPAESHDATERLRGFKAAVREAGLDPSNIHEIQSEFSREAGYEAVSDILALSPRPTAVVAPNDYCALGVLRGFREAGINVPDDISVTGFDDIPSAEFTLPSLTTVHVPIYEIGKVAVEQLLGLIRGDLDEGPRHVEMPVRLVVRNSTGPPR